MPGEMKHKLESRLPGEISTSSDIDDTTPLTENEEELKNFLIRVKESKKAGLKTQHSKNEYHVNLVPSLHGK